jgi:voltage-gated potassium channel
MFKFIIDIFKYAFAILKGLKDPEFRGLMLFVAGILTAGTFFYHHVEKWRWLDSLYFSVATLTTVGYGDFSPHTDAGKIFTIIYIFFGVGIILGFVNSVAKHVKEQNAILISRDSRKQERKLKRDYKQ